MNLQPETLNVAGVFCLFAFSTDLVQMGYFMNNSWLWLSKNTTDDQYNTQPPPFFAHVAIWKISLFEKKILLKLYKMQQDFDERREK